MRLKTEKRALFECKQRNLERSSDIPVNYFEYIYRIVVYSRHTVVQLASAKLIEGGSSSKGNRFAARGALQPVQQNGIPLQQRL